MVIGALFNVASLPCTEDDRTLLRSNREDFIGFFIIVVNVWSQPYARTDARPDDVLETAVPPTRHKEDARSVIDDRSIIVIFVVIYCLIYVLFNDLAVRDLLVIFDTMVSESWSHALAWVGFRSIDFYFVLGFSIDRYNFYSSHQMVCVKARNTDLCIP